MTNTGSYPIEGEGMIIKNGEPHFTPQYLALKLIEDIKRDSPKSMKEIVASCLEMRNILLIAMEDVVPASKRIEDESAAVLRQLRDSRAAIGIEVKHLLSDLKDIRQFFLGKEHDVEVQKLKELAELCERLQTLKKNGTLDALMDTILKLA